MRILAITDGSIVAQKSIRAISGIVPVDQHILPSPIPNELKRADVLVLTFERFPTRNLQTLLNWLRAQQVGRIPFVLCISPQDIANFSSLIRQISATVISIPVVDSVLMDALEKCYHPFGVLRRNKAALPARTAQVLSNVFGSLAHQPNIDPQKIVDQILETSQDVNAALKLNGLEAWLTAISEHHSYTARHCMSVAGFASNWAQRLGFSPQDQNRFTLAALLHDIGKISIPLAILDKPSRLTDEERLVVNAHPTMGRDILSQQQGVCSIVKDIVYSHHESLDGTGYPRGLSGSDISRPVRCMTIIDIYSALVDTRAYKEPMAPMKAYDELCSMQGKLDMNLVAAFKTVVDEHASSFELAA